VSTSCGSDSYVSDEVITSHAGARVSVGNTDAEGRMVLADCLSHCREKALAGTPALKNKGNFI
jgi:leucyl aminopeptidase